jgi:hypothetical protein
MYPPCAVAPVRTVTRTERASISQAKLTSYLSGATHMAEEEKELTTGQKAARTRMLRRRADKAAKTKMLRKRAAKAVETKAKNAAANKRQLPFLKRLRIEKKKIAVKRKKPN